MGMIQLQDVTISDSDYHRILTVLGYPKLKEEDYDWTKEDIINFAILPAMEEYFSYYPLLNEYQAQIGAGTFDIDFPDEYTYGITYIAVNPINTQSYITHNPFIDAGNVSTVSSPFAGPRKYGTRNDYGFRQVNEINYQDRLTNTNRFKALKYSIDYENKKVTGYCSIIGVLNIDFAEFSPNFSMIRKQHLNEVISLAKAKLKIFLGESVGYLELDLPMQLDGETLRSEGKEEQDEILDIWRDSAILSIRRN